MSFERFAQRGAGEMTHDFSEGGVDIQALSFLHKVFKVIYNEIKDWDNTRPLLYKNPSEEMEQPINNQRV